jgi:uncharacterized protein
LAGRLRLSLASGFVAGLVGALLGVGGGVTLIPILVAAGVNERLAVGTSLAASSFVTSAGALTLAGHVDVTKALELGIPAAAAAVAGARVHWRFSEHGLRRALGVVLLGVAALLLAR